MYGTAVVIPGSGAALTGEVEERKERELEEHSEQGLAL